MGISRILLLPNPRFAVVWPLLLVAGTGDRLRTHPAPCSA